MKIRNGFVSNSSSSAFIFPSDALTGKDIANLAMAFDRVTINENREIVVEYSCGDTLAVKIVEELIKHTNARKTSII